MKSDWIVDKIYCHISISFVRRTNLFIFHTMSRCEHLSAIHFFHLLFLSARRTVSCFFVFRLFLFSSSSCHAFWDKPKQNVHGNCAGFLRRHHCFLNKNEKKINLRTHNRLRPFARPFDEGNQVSQWRKSIELVERCISDILLLWKARHTNRSAHWHSNVNKNTWHPKWKNKIEC